MNNIDLERIRWKLVLDRHRALNEQMNQIYPLLMFSLIGSIIAIPVFVLILAFSL